MNANCKLNQFSFGECHGSKALTRNTDVGTADLAVYHDRPPAQLLSSPLVPTTRTRALGPLLHDHIVTIPRTQLISVLYCWRANLEKGTYSEPLAVVVKTASPQTLEASHGGCFG